MLNFINKNNWLSFERFGFTTNSSIEQAITTIYNKFLNILGNNQNICAIFIDIKKAFN